jgi:hypothetical protein
MIRPWPLVSAPVTYASVPNDETGSSRPAGQSRRVMMEVGSLECEEDGWTSPSHVDDELLRAIAYAPARWLPPVLHPLNLSPVTLQATRTSAKPADQDASERAQRFEVEREELVAATLRFRQALSLGLSMWLAFGALDVLVDFVFELHHLVAFAALRLGGAIMIATSRILLLKRPPRSFAAFTLHDIISYTAATTLISMMCTLFWGLGSPYAPGICLVIAHRMAIAHESWRKALLTNGVPALSFFVVLLIATWVDPAKRFQLHDGRKLTLFAINAAFVLGTAATMVHRSHFVWSLRRQLFEARNIGRYKLKRRLGAGGMGEVWLAHDRVLKRDLALKFLRADARRDRATGAIARFEREVQATAELTHLNTVRVFDYGTTADGLCYYAMEYLEGETMTKLVLREGPLGPQRAVSMVLQAARALAEAHARGIIHRDVKPDNLFVTTLGGEHDVIKVLDFGVAMFTQREDDVTATRAGSLLGTPAYLSPEVASGQRATARSDVYSLGAVLYFLLCGRRPFEAENEQLLLQAHLRERPVPPSAKLGQALPQDLEAVVLRCLEKEPSARFVSAGALAAALVRCVGVPLM